MLINHNKNGVITVIISLKYRYMLEKLHIEQGIFFFSKWQEHNNEVVSKVVGAIRQSMRPKNRLSICLSYPQLSLVDSKINCSVFQQTFAVDIRVVITSLREIADPHLIDIRCWYPPITERCFHVCVLESQKYFQRSIEGTKGNIIGRCNLY